MRMQKQKLRNLVALLVVALVLGCWSGVASAYWTDLIDQMTPFNTSGPESTAEVNQTYIDLTNVSSGSVTSATYIGASQTRTDNSYTVASQTYIDAMDRITSYVFALTNQYRPDTDMGLSGVDYLPTVHVYTYGTQKDQAMYSVVSGLVDCLGNPPIRGDGGGSSSSWINNYSPTAMASTTITSFKIGEKSITTASGTTITMDVAPYVKDGRTYTPVRYLAYALGVPESGVQWDEATQTVTIVKGDTVLKMSIGNTTMTKNGEIIVMDVAPELVDPGRTMLPARWVSEALGATVTWDEVTQQVVIKQGT
ncbi:copper amine oxidase N-terminal domain-containing protein [Pelotomaculum isophthalicicum JI]|uniref:Copper amine oxidase N-terminal domain-containing protein n=1 Tax=Pelotomaculum isophthalicicum JI TaxID=947010 RepID=A0A9X4H451_9FIRM|nr:copper amine oxidase N-terminal domain-containing protein [Pelotomaculum isophthalicicum]MDF9409541.1 copper amine oxidase N-terminal domain-containing protein [Pelotomaculum isophthalicicum JI]